MDDWDKEVITVLTREFFKIVGCGTCEGESKKYYCDRCNMNKGSGCYYNVSRKLAQEFAEAVLEAIGGKE